MPGHAIDITTESLTRGNDDVLRLLRLTGQVVIQNRLGASSIACLGIECCAGVVGDHAVSTTQRVLHRAPRVIPGRRLDIPDITGVACRTLVRIWL